VLSPPPDFTDDDLPGTGTLRYVTALSVT